MQNTVQTGLAGIMMSLPREHFVISGSEVSIASDDVRKCNATLSISEYDDLIHQGAEEIKQNIQAAIDSQEYGRVVATLTGGRDSRVIFAGKDFSEAQLPTS